MRDTLQVLSVGLGGASASIVEGQISGATPDYSNMASALVQVLIGIMTLIGLFKVNFPRNKQSK